jgi:aminopeptidase N
VPDDKEPITVQVASEERTPVAEMEDREVPDLVLLNDGDRTYCKLLLDARSLATLKDRLGTLEDPLARAVCWTALWDMVRDASPELPAGHYLKVALAQLPRETELATLQRLLPGQIGPPGALSRTAAAALVFGDPAGRDEARGWLTETAREAMSSATPGSELQLVWAQAFAYATRVQEDHDELRNVLDTGRWLAGIKVDLGLRWLIVESLAAAGAIDEGGVAEQLKLNDDVTWKRRQAAALAARPTAAAKEEAWGKIVGSGDDLAYTRDRMRGFLQPDQEAVLEPYRERYFEALRELGKQPERGRRFAEAMYPLASPETITDTEQFLDSGSTPSAVRRVVLEGLDEARRVLKARAVDNQARRPRDTPRRRPRSRRTQG